MLNDENEILPEDDVEPLTTREKVQRVFLIIGGLGILTLGAGIFIPGANQACLPGTCMIGAGAVGGLITIPSFFNFKDLRQQIPPGQDDSSYYNDL